MVKWGLFRFSENRTANRTACTCRCMCSFYVFTVVDGAVTVFGNRFELVHVWPCDESSFLNTPTSLTQKTIKQITNKKQISVFCKEWAELIVFIFITKILGPPTRRPPCSSTTPSTTFIILLWSTWTSSNSKPFKTFLQNLDVRRWACQLGPL